MNLQNLRIRKINRVRKRCANFILNCLCVFHFLFKLSGNNSTDQVSMTYRMTACFTYTSDQCPVSTRGIFLQKVNIHGVTILNIFSPEIHQENSLGLNLISNGLASFLNLLKISENLWFSDVLRGYRNKILAGNELIPEHTTLASTGKKTTFMNKKSKMRFWGLNGAE